MASTHLKLPLLISVMLIFVSATMNAQPKTLYDQLASVNQEWNNQTDVPAALRSTAAKPFNEQQLIQFHLEQTELLLRNRKTTHLSAAQQKKRDSNLNTLHKYWQRGIFPINDGHVGRQPYFIDKYNTYCAVGYLIQQSGADDIARDINRTQNFSYLIDINHPRLMDWAHNSGLSLDELALIQPAYAGDWPCAITEIHYNNTGVDVNEYIEVHQLAALFIDGRFASILFYDASGTLYKTLPIAAMSGFAGGYYYNFPVNESLADSGRIEMVNGNGGLLFVFYYNGSGVTIEDHNPVGIITTTSYTVIEDENTPVGYSMSFCGTYGTPSWVPTINPPTMGIFNPCILTALSLSSFNYTTNGKTVQLKWQTASESNTDRFVVERSTDGVNFNSIGNVQAAGNSNTTRSYTFTDDHPNYINHYRLKLVNLDGSISYSRILYVKIAAANPLSLSSNLVNNSLQININSSNSIIGSLLLYDFSGKKIMELAAKPNSQVIDVSGLSAGKYLVRLITTDGQAFTQVFLKQ